MPIDMHSHTTASDGSLTPTELVVRVDGPHDFVVARFLPPQCLVPDLRKATITVARSKLLAAGCATGQVTNVRSKVKKGSVIAQSVKPGAQLCLFGRDRLPALGQQVIDP